jgi:hypothetical protein
MSILGLATPYMVVLFIFNELRREVVVCFVDIGGIVDHNFLYRQNKTTKCRLTF